jgi:hypothetical protein
LWSESDERIYLASGWFFVAPLLLGAAGVALLIFQRCHKADQSLIGARK